MDWYRSLPDYRRKTYLLLIVAILLTLPCYCIGLALLILGPEGSPSPEATPTGTEASDGGLLPAGAPEPGPLPSRWEPGAGQACRLVSPGGAGAQLRAGP